MKKKAKAASVTVFAKCSICSKPTDCVQERGGHHSYYCGLECLNAGRAREDSLQSFYVKAERMSQLGKRVRV